MCVVYVGELKIQLSTNLILYLYYVSIQPFLDQEYLYRKQSVHKAQGHHYGLEGFGEYNDIGLAYNALRRQVPTPSKVVHIWDAVRARRDGNGLDRGDHDQGPVVVGVERQS